MTRAELVEEVTRVADLSPVAQEGFAAGSVLRDVGTGNPDPELIPELSGALAGVFSLVVVPLTFPSQAVGLVYVDRLTDNLRVIHETQQIDDALHGLTAAIHLLTARHQGGPQTKAA